MNLPPTLPNMVRYRCPAARCGSPGKLARRGGCTWSGRRLDGPPVSPPRRRGYGSRLIERALTAGVDGEIRLQFLIEGVRCSMDMPLERLAIH